MHKKFVYGIAGCGALLALLLVLSGGTQLWSQDAPSASPFKNVQVLKFETKPELQKYMQTVAKSLGVQCKFCHDLTDFSKDVPELHKEISRKMMKMTMTINTDFKDLFVRGGQPTEVTCFTCHQGRAHPIHTLEDLQKLQAEEGQ